MKKFVLDTNVLLNDPSSILSFNEHHVILPMTVIEELDNIKSRKNDVSRDARVVIRQIEDIVGDSDYEQLKHGIKISEVIKGVPETALFSIIQDEAPVGYGTVQLDSEVPDNRIINTVISLQLRYPDDEIVLVSNDINMRLKAKGAGCKYVESCKKEKSLADIDILHKGYQYIEGSIFEQVSVSDSSINKDRKCIHTFPKNEVSEKLFGTLLINDYIHDDMNVLLRLTGKNEDSYFFIDIGSKGFKKTAWGVEAKNIYQTMAISSLLDPNIDLVVLLGPAGTGKTLLTVAAGLEQTMEKRIFDKIIFTRSMQSQFEEIGFLPGTETEKVAPWCGAAYDALEFIHRKDANPAGSLKLIEDKGIFQYKALTFIRGRSFKDKFLVIDEAQNLNATQMKTILTRAGEGTKIILMGNLAQIDNDYVSELSSGLTYVVEKFKGWEGCSIVQLQSTVRSRLADFAEQNL